MIAVLLDRHRFWISWLAILASSSINIASAEIEAVDLTQRIIVEAVGGPQEGSEIIYVIGAVCAIVWSWTITVVITWLAIDGADHKQKSWD